MSQVGERHLARAILIEQNEHPPHLLLRVHSTLQTKEEEEENEEEKNRKEKQADEKQGGGMRTQET